jgi:NAD(P)-dependent dehydrogenase (short-subunit alcohol dehydrogenase family)
VPDGPRLGVELDPKVDQTLRPTGAPRFSLDRDTVVDARAPPQIQQAVGDALGKHGRIDILINNAQASISADRNWPVNNASSGGGPGMNAANLVQMGWILGETDVLQRLIS